MKIHELNNYGGSLGDAYLVADNGSDTGKIKTTEITDPLNDRIDNIIGGTAPSAAEIVDARLGANGVIYPLLGDAIRGQVSNITGSLNYIYDNEDIIVINGLDYSTLSQGKYYNDSGTLIDSNDYMYSEEYVRIKPNTSYAFEWFSGDIGHILRYFAVCVYDVNKNFISQIRFQDNFISPDNAYWIRISFIKQVTDMVMFYEYKGNRPTNYIPFRVTTNFLELEKNFGTLESNFNSITEINNIQIELPDSLKVVTPKYYKGLNGDDAGPYDSWEYITVDVEGGEAYNVTAYAGQAARLWLVFNDQNQLLAFSSYSGGVELKTESFTIPEDGSKLYVNSRFYSTAEKNQISIKKINSEVYVDADRIITHNGKPLDQYISESNILYGKTLVCCGDSITYGADMDPEGILPDGTLKTWGWQIANRNNMTFYNDGVSGSTMQGIADKNGFSLPNGRYTQLPDEIDYLVIWFGWNDTTYGTLGTLNDETNNSFYGGYNVVLPYLLNKYPYTKICLVVPFGSDAAHREAVRKLADKWGVACWDNYKGGTPLYYGKEAEVGVLESVVLANQQKFQAVGAHPNYKGHKQLGDMIEAFLRTI